MDPWRCAETPTGYAWWYIDVAGGGYALTAILFAGAVFSPQWARAVRFGEADVRGVDYPAVNLALWRLGASGDRPQEVAWVLSEHAPQALVAHPDGIQVGHSRLVRGVGGDPGAIRLDLRERATRFGGFSGARVRGRIEVRAEPLDLAPVELCRTAAGEVHHWAPLGLGGQAEVDLEVGGQRHHFRGAAYCDSNFGTGRLERAMSSWGWAHLERPGETLVLYRTRPRPDVGLLTGLSIEVHKRAGGPAQLRTAPAYLDVDREPGQRYRWLTVPSRLSAVQRVCEPAPGPALLDAPFYARYQARVRPPGEVPYEGVGEYVDLQRFSRRWVQLMLGFKGRRT